MSPCTVGEVTSRNGPLDNRKTYIELESGKYASVCGWSGLGPARRGNPCSKEVDERVASALPLQASSCIDPHNSGGEGGWRAVGREG